jgi:hypothetical protein
VPYPSAAHLVPSHAHAYGNLVANGNSHFPHVPVQSHVQSPSIGPSSQNLSAATETVHLYVPNTLIGAIIGSKGLFIKSIIKNSSASVKVMQNITCTN